MKKVLQIANYREKVGGISGQVELLKRHLDEDGYIAEIFSTKGTIVRRLWMPFHLLKIAQSFDVLHIHCCSDWGFFPAVLGISVGKMLGKRIILSYHGGDAGVFFEKHPRFVKRWLLRTNTNIALSGFVGEEFAKRGLPYTIISNILEFNESQYRKRDIIHPDFICTRAHEPLYNIPCILRAFSIVQKQLPESTLTLVGGGSQHEALKVMTKEMKLQGVLFTGHVENRKIYDYLAKADILLSSPRIDNFPVSVLEAMNAGLLVISSNVGGVPFLIEDGKTGFLFSSNDEQALAERMLQAVTNQKESTQIISNAKKEVSKYSWSVVGDKIKRLYE